MKQTSDTALWYQAFQTIRRMRIMVPLEVDSERAYPYSRHFAEVVNCVPSLAANR